MHIAVIANTTWYLFNFRVGLVESLQARGHKVTLIAPADAYVEKVKDLGLTHRVWKLSGSSVNPFREVAAVVRLRRILIEEKIDTILSYTPKGNIYSALSSCYLNIDFIPNISGLGSIFVKESMLMAVVKTLYHFTLKKARKVFFQNNEDMNAFLDLGLVSDSQAERIPGSGVDLKKFCSSGLSVDKSNNVVFLLVARLLWEKGIGEYVKAGRIVKLDYPNVELHVIGFLDAQNPAAIPEAQIVSWQEKGDITYHGATDDVIDFLKMADCVVLPSYYREGVPRSLLEAAAMSIPVITTNEPGCRDVVDPGVTGLLCKSRDPSDLAGKMDLFLSMSVEARMQMGKRAREKMANEFNEQIVVDRYLDVISAGV